MKRFEILAAALLALAVATPGAAAEKEKRKAGWDWQGTVAPGNAVEIKGVNGGIDAQGTSGDKVVVTAMRTGRRSDPEEVKIEVVEHSGGVTICAVYPTSGTPNECRPGEGGRMNVHDNDVNVEFKVQVPKGVRFIGRTVNGGIHARGIEADAEAHTVNGGIEVEAAGTARAQTVNGGITARLGRADWTGTLDLKTVNGGIDVSLPASAAAEVNAATVNGDIETEFPLTVTGKFGHRRMKGTIGGGGAGRTLALETVNGGISLRKAM
jgi:hypothetical protein